MVSLALLVADNVPVRVEAVPDPHLGAGAAGAAATAQFAPAGPG